MVICEKYLLTHSLQNGSFSMCFTYWGGSDSKSICLQWGRPGFDPLFRKKPCTRKWHPTPVLLPGKSHGWRNLVGYSPWGRKESDMTEWLHFLSFFLSFFLFLLRNLSLKKHSKRKKKHPTGTYIYQIIDQLIFFSWIGPVNVLMPLWLLIQFQGSPLWCYICSVSKYYCFN